MIASRESLPYLVLRYLYNVIGGEVDLPNNQVATVGSTTYRETINFYSIT